MHGNGAGGFVIIVIPLGPMQIRIHDLKVKVHVEQLFSIVTLGISINVLTRLVNFAFNHPHPSSDWAQAASVLPLVWPR